MMLRNNSTLTSISLAANKVGFKYYDRPARKPVSDNIVQMMPHTYSNCGSTALMQSISDSVTVYSINLAMNHIDTSSGAKLVSLIEEKSNLTNWRLAKINLNGNEIGQEVAGKLQKYSSIDISDQVRMKTWSSAAMQTPCARLCPYYRRFSG